VADTSINVGVVGLGSFGKHHVRHYARNPRARLVAVSDVDSERASAFAAEFGATAFTDYRDLIGKVDAVSIAVPAAGHHDVAAAFIAAGVHVFVEKPLAATTDAARALAAAASACGVVLQVGHIERFNPAVTAIEQRIGQPRRMAFRRLSAWNGRATDVDVIFDLMIHDIDLALHFAQSPVRSVAGSGQVARSSTIDEAEAWLTFENGAIATLSASRVAPQTERRITISEPGAAYVADLGAPGLAVTRRGEPTPTIIPLEAHDNLGAEIDSFLACVADGAAPRVGGEAGVAAVDIAERIRAAIDAGAPAIRSV
jgi:predicted dehydrogenase